MLLESFLEQKCINVPISNYLYNYNMLSIFYLKDINLRKILHKVRKV